MTCSIADPGSARARPLITAIFGLLLICGETPNSRATPEKHHGSLVEITVTYQEYDQIFPWQRRPPGLRRGYGVVIDTGQVLTTETLLRNAELVELRQARRGEKVRATIALSDPQCNLGLLNVPPQGLADLQVASPAESIATSNKLMVLQFDQDSEVQAGSAQILEVGVRPLPRSPFSLLAFTVLTDLNVNGEGAPVFVDGKLAGIMITYNSNTRTGNMLPSKIIRRFIADTKRPLYRGMASAGFVWSPLVDPVKRAYLNVQDKSGGILIVKCLPGTGAAEAFQPNDVVLQWDGFNLDNLGYYEDPEFGRLAFPHLIGGYREPGDVVPVRVVRQGLETNVNVRLQRYEDDLALVPENVIGEAPEYIAEGGFVIRELDARYLFAHGNDWYQRVDSRLVHAYMTRKFSPSRPGERIVILTAVLPDRINTGYEHFRQEIVTHVNGRPILNLRDVFKILDEDGSLYSIRLKDCGIDLVLDKRELRAANARLTSAYRLPALHYRNLSRR